MSCADRAVGSYLSFILVGDPNEQVNNNKNVHQATLGLNYYLRQNRLKLMADYVFRREAIQPVASNLFHMQFQCFLH